MLYLVICEGWLHEDQNFYNCWMAPTLLIKEYDITMIIYSNTYVISDLNLYKTHHQ